MKIIDFKDHSSLFPGAFAVMLGSAIWGLYWLPLRYLENLGLSGYTASALMTGLAGLPLVLTLPWTKAIHRDNWRETVAFGCGTGGAICLYSLSLVYTDVVRALFLFYLMPVWAALMSWLLSGKMPRAIRIAAIICGLAGLWLMLGGIDGLPVPHNIGDVFGLAAGFIFAIAVTAMTRTDNVGPIALTVGCFVAGTVFALLIGALLPISPRSIDGPGLGLTAMLIMIGVCCFISMPGNLMIYWGARILPPVTTSILMMSETLVGTLSAVALGATDLTWVGYVGAGMIFLAVILDLSAEARKSNEAQ